MTVGCRKMTCGSTWLSDPPLSKSGQATPKEEEEKKTALSTEVQKHS